MRSPSGLISSSYLEPATAHACFIVATQSLTVQDLVGRGVVATIGGESDGSTVVTVRGLALDPSQATAHPLSHRLWAEQEPPSQAE